MNEVVNIINSRDIMVVTMDEVKKLIKFIPNEKAPGPSGIAYEIFKLEPDELYNWVSKFFTIIYSTKNTNQLETRN